MHNALMLLPAVYKEEHAECATHFGQCLYIVSGAVWLWEGLENCEREVLFRASTNLRVFTVIGLQL